MDEVRLRKNFQQLQGQGNDMANNTTSNCEKSKRANSGNAGGEYKERTLEDYI